MRLLVPRRRPDAQLALRRGERVGEDERPLLGEPDRRLVAAAAVVEREEPARQLVAGLDPLQLGLRNVVPPEEVRPVGAGAVALDEAVDVADVVGLEDHDDGRRARVEALPDLPSVVGRRQRVDEHDLAAGLDAGGGHGRLPVGIRRPVGMLKAPDPEARREIAELGRRQDRILSPAGSQSGSSAIVPGTHSPKISTWTSRPASADCAGT